ncbi:hypothetical protein Rsub_00115 [Raphidocelis subcapitata]|uniref:Protein kinase domain-containing protein n=1 Tax=Raphidocelis subcapitata TaxID=307507 RepID=A0A2V0NJK7_9CHLO|nr:hypothetical protein Rsub_00115 [Raphidocelis subcapitata]|eukprot:GBF87404.1 hypothetical protein Rsub_00115 [Raphidocelis subcapitata]
MGSPRGPPQTPQRLLLHLIVLLAACSRAHGGRGAAGARAAASIGCAAPLDAPPAAPPAASYVPRRRLLQQTGAPGAPQARRQEPAQPAGLEQPAPAAQAAPAPGQQARAVVAAGANASAEVAAALMEPSVSEITVNASRVALSTQLFPGYGPGRSKGPLLIDRNVTIAAAAGAAGPAGGPPLMDFGLLDGLLVLRAGAVLTLKDLQVTKIRYGPGAGADFARGEGPASVLAFQNVIWRVVVCLPANVSRNGTASFAAAAAAGGAPQGPNPEGKGTAPVHQESVCLAPGECYSDALHVVSARIPVAPRASDIGGTLHGAGQGADGVYTWDLRNLTRVCLHQVPQDCLDRSSPNACYEQAFQAFSDESCWQDRAAQEAAARHGRAAALGGGLGGGLGAALVAGGGAATFLARRGRRRRAAAATAAAAAADEERGHQTGGGEAGGAWRSGVEGAVRSSGPVPPGKLGSSWRLMSKFSAPWAGAADANSPQLDQVQLGVLIGAGSFGRVYKGRWQGRDVAVKVMLHNDLQLSERIQSEIRLMLSFRHTNIVEALHYVAWFKEDASSEGHGQGSSHSSRDPGGFEPCEGDTYAPSDQAGGSYLKDASWASSQPNAPAPAQQPQRQQPQRQQPQPRRLQGQQLPRGQQPEGQQLLQGQQLPQGQQQQQLQQQQQVEKRQEGQQAQSPEPRAERQRSGCSSPFGGASGSESTSSPSASGPGFAAAPRAPAAAAGVAPRAARRSSSASRGDPATNRLLIEMMGPGAAAAGGDASESAAGGDASESADGGRGWGGGWGGGGAAALSSVASAGDFAGSGSGGLALESAQGEAWPRDAPGAGTGGAGSIGDAGAERDRSGATAGARGSGRRARQGAGLGAGEAQTWLVLEWCSEGSLADAVRSGLLHSPGSTPACGSPTAAPRRASSDTLQTDSVVTGPANAEAAAAAASFASLDLPRALALLLDVARGMAYLHARNVVHADLKCQNVLLMLAPGRDDFGLRAKITDFGLSRALSLGQTHVTTHSMGTITHMPPEMFKTGRMSPAGDVYAFGVMVWEVITGRGAFHGLHYAEVIEQVAIRGARPPVPEAAPPELRALMEACWQADPTKRPGFDALVTCLELLMAACGVRPDGSGNGGAVLAGPGLGGASPRRGIGAACCKAGSGAEGGADAPVGDRAQRQDWLPPSPQQRRQQQPQQQARAAAAAAQPRPVLSQSRFIGGWDD